MELADYAGAVRRHWILFAAVLVAAVAAGGAATLLRPPAYRSTTVLFIAENPAATTADAAGQRVQSYLSLLRSRQVARQVRDDLRLKRGIDQVQAALSADRDPDTMLLTVTATDPDSKRSAAMAAAAGRSLDALAKDVEPAHPATITVAQPPLTTRSPTHLTRNVALALLLGLVAGLAAVALRESLRWRVRTAADAERLGVPLLGTTSGLPEDHRRIRARLRAIAGPAGPRSLLVTSPGRGEGASVVVRGLAAALAESGRKVVVLDADLRGGADPRYPGLTGLLSGDQSLSGVLRVMPGGSVKLVPAGEAPGDPGRALADPALAGVIGRLESGFDVVLVNGPPVSGSADTSILSGLTGGVVLTVQAGRTRIREADRAMAALRDVGAQVLGVVLVVRPPRRAPVVREVPTADLPSIGAAPVSPARPASAPPADTANGHVPASGPPSMTRQVPLG